MEIINVTVNEIQAKKLKKGTFGHTSCPEIIHPTIVIYWCQMFVSTSITEFFLFGVSP